jgi:hypothetical protein
VQSYRDNCGNRRYAQNDLKIGAGKEFSPCPDRKNCRHDRQANKLTANSTSAKPVPSFRRKSFNRGARSAEKF